MFVSILLIFDPYQINSKDNVRYNIRSRSNIPYDNVDEDDISSILMNYLKNSKENGLFLEYASEHEYNLTTLKYLTDVAPFVNDLRFANNIIISGLEGIESMNNLKTILCYHRVTNLFGLEWCDKLEELRIPHSPFSIGHLSNLKLSRFGIPPYPDPKITSDNGLCWSLADIHTESLIHLYIDKETVTLLDPEIYPRLGNLKLIKISNIKRITYHIQSYLNYVLSQINTCGIWFCCGEIMHVGNEYAMTIYPKATYVHPIVETIIKTDCQMTICLCTKDNYQISIEDMTMSIPSENKIVFTANTLEELYDKLITNTYSNSTISIIIQGCDTNDVFYLPHLQFLDGIAEKISSIRMSGNFKMASLEGIEKCCNLFDFDCEEQLYETNLTNLKYCLYLKSLKLCLGDLETSQLQNLKLNKLHVEKAKSCENLGYLYSHNLSQFTLDEKSSKYLPYIVRPIYPAYPKLRKLKIILDSNRQLNNSIISEAVIKFWNGYQFEGGTVFSINDGSFEMHVDVGLKNED
jgi:hypothetical protein